jgi:hypothetical protein
VLHAGAVLYVVSFKTFQFFQIVKSWCAGRSNPLKSLEKKPLHRIAKCLKSLIKRWGLKSSYRVYRGTTGHLTTWDHWVFLTSPVVPVLSNPLAYSVRKRAGITGGHTSHAHRCYARKGWQPPGLPANSKMRSQNKYFHAR